MKKKNPRKPLSILQYGRGCEAGDARDRIYALLGLSEDANKLSIHIKYPERANLFERVARVLILTDSGVEILYGVGG